MIRWAGALLGACAVALASAPGARMAVHAQAVPTTIATTTTIPTTIPGYATTVPTVLPGTPPPTPTPQPTAQPTPGVLAVTPSFLDIGGVGQSAMLSITQAHYTGAITVASQNCPTYLTITPPRVVGPSGSVRVTANAVSSACVVIVTGYAHSVTVNVSVAGTPSPTPAPTPSGTVVWAAGHPTLGRWVVANTYQCTQTPQQSDTMFYFQMLRESDGSCGRNQANPEGNGGSGVYFLDFGRHYTLRFHYVDGKPDGTPPGMGYDADARSLVWQLHTYSGSSNCLQLSFDNGGTIGHPQQWDWNDTCGGTPAHTRWAYTPGEEDDFVIEVVPANGSSGVASLYRFNHLIATIHGKNCDGSAKCWWNFGPYKWIWEPGLGAGSTMHEVNATFVDVVLTSP